MSGLLPPLFLLSQGALRTSSDSLPVTHSLSTSCHTHPFFFSPHHVIPLSGQQRQQKRGRTRGGWKGKQTQRDAMTKEDSGILLVVSGQVRRFSLISGEGHSLFTGLCDGNGILWQGNSLALISPCLVQAPQASIGER